jgi:hypothetical protein
MDCGLAIFIEVGCEVLVSLVLGWDLNFTPKLCITSFSKEFIVIEVLLLLL